MDALLIEVFLDVDATGDPLHGQQEGRFFHGYYRRYCYLPLYVSAVRATPVGGSRSPAHGVVACGPEENRGQYCAPPFRDREGHRTRRKGQYATLGRRVRLSLGHHQSRRGKEE